ncbi:TPA: hypothetical protein DEP96_01880 [Candidatus Uhrbacteria bacterium]|nr:hypothetical protein [Candidatus Uhrbacteria bacterium]
MIPFSLLTILACSGRSPVHNLNRSDVLHIADDAHGQYIWTVASLTGHPIEADKSLEIGLVGLGTGYMVRGDRVVNGEHTSNLPVVASYLNADFEPQNYYNLQGWSKCINANKPLTGDCLAEANQFVELAFVSFGARRSNVDADK